MRLTEKINFQNYIQHNKDWNSNSISSLLCRVHFQNYIQHNKDWNGTEFWCKWLPICLPELHPAQQGLKLTGNSIDGLTTSSSRTTSSTTRIETKVVVKVRFSFQTSRTTSSTTRIETEQPKIIQLSEKNLPELHPAQQGLKLVTIASDWSTGLDVVLEDRRTA